MKLFVKNVINFSMRTLFAHSKYQDSLLYCFGLSDFIPVKAVSKMKCGCCLLLANKTFIACFNFSTRLEERTRVTGTERGSNISPLIMSSIPLTSGMEVMFHKNR